PPMLMTTVLLVMVALLMAAEPPLASPPPPLPRRPKAVLRLIVLLLITSEPESRPSKAPPVTVAELLNAALSGRMSWPLLVLARPPPAIAELPEMEQKATRTTPVPELRMAPPKDVAALPLVRERPEMLTRVVPLVTRKMRPAALPFTVMLVAPLP